MNTGEFQSPPRVNKMFFKRIVSFLYIVWQKCDGLIIVSRVLNYLSVINLFTPLDNRKLMMLHVFCALLFDNGIHIYHRKE